MKIITHILILLFITSCSNGNKNKNGLTSNSEINSDTSIAKEIFTNYWYSDFDTIENRDCIIRGKYLDSIPNNVDYLIKILNTRLAKCKIDFIRISNDTIFIKILDEYYLTQQMGTTGAWTWLAETTFTLTENSDFKTINMDFEFGDHATPGNYNRQTFNDLKVIE